MTCGGVAFGTQKSSLPAFLSRRDELFKQRSPDGMPTDAERRYGTDFKGKPLAFVRHVRLIASLALVVRLVFHLINNGRS